jgi:hypothetical protein
MTQPQWPHAGPYPPPAKSQKGLVIGLVIGIGASVCLIGAIVVVGLIYFVNAATNPVDAANAYLAELRAGDIRGANARLCAKTHAEIGTERLTGQYEELTEKIGELRSYNLTSVEVKGSSAVVRGTATFDRTHAVAIDMHLDEANGDAMWQPCEFHVDI